MKFYTVLGTSFPNMFISMFPADLSPIVTDIITLWVGVN